MENLWMRMQLARNGMDRFQENVVEKYIKIVKWILANNYWSYKKKKTRLESHILNIRLMMGLGKKMFERLVLNRQKKHQ